MHFSILVIKCLIIVCYNYHFFLQIDRLKSGKIASLGNPLWENNVNLDHEYTRYCLVFFVYLVVYLQYNSVLFCVYF
jgi:hypothetical protein